MSALSVTLVDAQRNVVATAQIDPDGDRFGGAADLRHMPPDMRQLFEEFEQAVNGQMFAFLDDIEQRIRALGLRAVFAEGPELAVEDLQIYPHGGRISFKAVKPAVAGTKQN
jgi:hypothetical protein